MSFRHVLWNFFGLGFPLLVAAGAIPKLLMLIGSERFGLLSLAWGLIGYASMLDLGIGRAVTQKISKFRGLGNLEEIPIILATAIRLTLFTSMFGMGLISLVAFAGVDRLYITESVPASEIKVSILLLALALPLQAISATYRGVNEAYLNFKSISLLRVILGITNFLGPLLIAYYSKNIINLVASLVISRGMALFFYRKYAYQCLEKSIQGCHGRYSPHAAKQLIKFGGWVTVTSVVGPLMVQSDRFFIGALISTAAVTLYVIPYEVIVQALIGVGAVTSVAFPAISKLLLVDQSAAKLLFRKWLIRVGVSMTIGMTGLAVVLPDLLEFWLGRVIEVESVMVGRILAIGVIFNSFGSMYFALLHAKGYSKPTALLHLLETPIYFSLLIVLIHELGVIGCAIAWTLRNVIDTIALMWMGHKLILGK